MSTTVFKLPVSIIRGGTSKGVYILQKDLPENKEEWDEILIRLMGSPDKRQIDGLGGATSVTSKVAIIQASERPDDLRRRVSDCGCAGDHRYVWVPYREFPDGRNCQGQQIKTEDKKA